MECSSAFKANTGIAPSHGMAGSFQILAIYYPLYISYATGYLEVKKSALMGNKSPNSPFCKVVSNRL
jgi:hypothetical protein